MTTAKGFIRSYSAALSRREKTNQKRQRDTERRLRQDDKLRTVLSARDSVIHFENHIKSISSVHKSVSDPLDWKEIADHPKPVEPSFVNTHEQKALDNLHLFSPGFLDKIFGYKWKKRKLEVAVTAAQEKDSDHHKHRLSEHQMEVTTWDQLQHISQGILSNDKQAHKKALEFFETFNDIEHVGTTLDIDFDPYFTVVNLYVHPPSIVPPEILSLTSTGKLSRWNMPETKSRKMYQEHICSAVFRCGREVLALLPVTFVVVHAQSSLLDTVTGKTGEQTIVSVALSRYGMDKIYFDFIDPVDSLKSFQPHMKLITGAPGFAPVEKINPEAIRVSY